MFASLTLDNLFLYCAWVGSIIYVIRILMSFGGVLDSDSMDSVADHISDDAFQFLSLNTLVGFLMMFGWGGLAASRQFLMSDPISLFVATCTGSLFFMATRLIFKSAKKLMSTGTVFDIQKSVGKQGKVYQRIAENKRGVIQVTLDDFCRELDAVSIDNREIPSFQSVEIIKVIDSRTVVVRRVK